MALTAFSLINAIALDIHLPIRPAKLNKSRKRARNMERVKGIELSFSAWEADDLPIDSKHAGTHLQSVLVLASRCRHWLDGVESQAFGRAFEHSGPSQIA